MISHVGATLKRIDTSTENGMNRTEQGNIETIE